MRLMKTEPYRGRVYFTDSPFGRLGLVENGAALTHLFFGPNDAPAGAETGESPLLLQAAQQLSQYFAGRRRDFDLPLAPFGTDFQRRVWRELRSIPYGQKSSYSQVAAAIGHPGASRAIGQANHRNPLAIIIPCHRVVGRGGQLVGYAGGLEIKDRLLSLEAEVLGGLVKHSD